MEKSNVQSREFIKKRWILIITMALAASIGLLIYAFPTPLWPAVALLLPIGLWLAKRPDTLFIFWLVASPLFNLFSGLGIPNLTLDLILLISLTGRMLFENFPRIRTSVDKRIPPNMFLFALLALYLIAESIGYVRGVWPIILSIKFFLDRALLLILAFWLTRRFIAFRGIAYAYSISYGLICVGVYSIVIEVLRRYLGIENLLYPKGRDYIWNDVPGSRAVGELYNPMIFGGIIVLVFLLAIFYPHRSSLLYRIRWIIGIACIWAIVMTYTRAVWLSFITNLLLMVFLYRRRLLRIMLITIGVIVLIISFASLVPNFWNQINERFSEHTAIVARKDLAIMNISMFLEKPLLGWGAGASDDKSYRIDMSNNSLHRGNPSHNSFLMMLADRGLATFIPYIAAILYLLYRNLRFYRNANENVRNIIIMVWVESIIYFIMANTIQVDFFTYFMALFWVLLGVADGLTILPAQTRSNLGLVS